MIHSICVTINSLYMLVTWLNDLKERQATVFQCDKCGLCCRHIDRSELFKEFDRGNGICKFFDDKSNLCSIYNIRPIICNVERSYEQFFSHFMTKEQYFELNYASCAALKREQR